MSEESSYLNHYSLNAQRESGTPTEVSDLVRGLEPLRRMLSEDFDKNPQCTIPALECIENCPCVTGNRYEEEDPADLKTLGYKYGDYCLCCGNGFFPVDGSKAADNPLRLEYCEKCATARCDVSTDEYRDAHCYPRKARKAVRAAHSEAESH